MQKEKLFGKTLSQIQAIVAELALPKYTATQITDWLYKKDINSIDDMSNLSKKNRELLAEKYEFGLVDFHKETVSVDGTKKYLFETHKGSFIETAMIPDENRHTVCVSSQMGCKMNCLFCATGKMGWSGNLTTGEILNQFRNIPEYPKMTNIVYMGMGEPLDNVDAVLGSLEILTSDYGFAWSPKRITVSSIGVIPGMEKFLDQSDAHLAISLHSPFDNEREEIMPVQKAYPIKKVLETIRTFDMGRQRRVSFEYIVFEGLNDTEAHADELVKILNGIRCRINLIRFHAIPDVDLRTTNEERLLAFQDRLKVKGLTTTIRASRGEDIFAACGLLSTKELMGKNDSMSQ
jgi:23S rRNA (adenine2503-C2)-methyltransferase